MIGFYSANSANQPAQTSRINRMRAGSNGLHTHLSADPVSGGKIGFQKEYTGKRRKPQLPRMKARWNWGTQMIEPRDGE